MSAFCGSSSTGARMSGRAGSCSNERYGSWEGAMQILEQPTGQGKGHHENHINLRGRGIDITNMTSIYGSGELIPQDSCINLQVKNSSIKVWVPGIGHHNS